MATDLNRCNILLDQMRAARAKGDHSSMDVSAMLLNHLNCPVKHLAGLRGGKKKSCKRVKSGPRKGRCAKKARRSRR